MGLTTYYLPAEFDDENEVGRELLHVAVSDTASQLVDCKDICLVVNNCRQIVFANEAFMEFMGFVSLKHVVGKRLGEVFMCVHSNECEGGCGTSQSCRECHIAQAFEHCLGGSKEEKGTCRLDSNSSGINDVLIEFTITSVELSDVQFYVVQLLVRA